MKIIKKSIPGFPGYLATSNGQIISKRFNRPLKTTKDKSGYLYITTSTNGKHKTLKVHRGVLLAFHGLPKYGQQCRHLNGNPSDNHAVNLRWGSIEENSKDKIKHNKQRNK